MVQGSKGIPRSTIAAHGARFAHLGVRRDPKAASSDKEPPPTSTRKRRASSMLTSVRASCKVPQNPFLANATILVEYKATTISMRSGTVASRVRKPINNRVPHTISTTPTNGAMMCGNGIPIFTKRPTPKESGNKNFWMPSDRKTHPTRIRINKTALGVRSAQADACSAGISCLFLPLTRNRTTLPSSHARFRSMLSFNKKWLQHLNGAVNLADFQTEKLRNKRIDVDIFKRRCACVFANIRTCCKEDTSHIWKMYGIVAVHAFVHVVRVSVGANNVRPIRHDHRVSNACIVGVVQVRWNGSPAVDAEFIRCRPELLVGPICLHFIVPIEKCTVGFEPGQVGKLVEIDRCTLLALHAMI